MVKQLMIPGSLSAPSGGAGGLVKPKDIYYGGLRIKEIWFRGERVYSSKPVEKAPSGDVRTWLVSKLRDYGTSESSVREIPFDIDTSSTTDFSYMFSSFSRLEEVPELNTSNGTASVNMFYDCKRIKTIPPIDTGGFRRMSSMFSGCTNLTSLPDLDLRSATEVNGMFADCSKLTLGNVRLIRPTRSLPGKRLNMIYNSGLTAEPWYLPDGTFIG